MSIIKQKNKLFETSQEEVSKLSQAINRPTAPVTPMETGVIGGTPDQAKMAGTPAQTGAAAIRTQVREEEDLATRLRREQPRREATAEEEAERRRAERLGGLEGLSGRVQAIAEQRLSGLEGGAEIEQEVAEEIDTETAELLDVLDDPNATPEQQQSALLQLNQKEGRGPGNQLTAEELKAKFQPARAALAEQVQQQVGGLTLTEDDYQQLGFASGEELAELLGVPAEEFAGMSVAEITDQIQAELDTEFRKVEDLEQKINDPYLGPAERAAARKNLRELGAVGVRGIESDIDKLADQIAEAETVELAGEQVNVQDMLSDDFYSGMIKNYFEDPEYKARLEADPAMEGFVKFMEDNAGALEQAATEIDDTVGQFSKLNTENQQLAQVGEAGEVDDKIMESVFGEDWGDLTTRNFREELASGQINSPALSYLTNDTMDAATKQALLDNVNSAAAMAPEFAQELMGLPIDSLKRIGALGTGPNQGKFKDWLIARNAAKDIDYNNPDDIINLISPGTTRKEFMSDVRDIQKKMNSGLFPEESLQKIADQTGLSGPKAVKSALSLNPIGFMGKLIRRSTNQENLSSLVQKMPESPITLFGEFTGVGETGTGDLYGIVESGFSATDPMLDGNEMGDILDTKDLDLETLINLDTNTDLANKMAPAAKTKLREAIEGTARKEADELVSKETKDILKGLETSFVRSDSPEFGRLRETINQQKDNIKIMADNPPNAEIGKQLKVILKEIDNQWADFAKRSRKETGETIETLREGEDIAAQVGQARAGGDTATAASLRKLAQAQKDPDIQALNEAAGDTITSDFVLGGGF